MSHRLFTLLVAALGLLFTLLFVILIGPALLRDMDVIGAFAAGFVNPYASGYAIDAITCWCILAVWVMHEARTHGVKHGWIAVLLGIVPGVAAGFAAYLLLRLRHEQASSRRDKPAR